MKQYRVNERQLRSAIRKVKSDPRMNLPQSSFGDAYEPFEDYFGIGYQFANFRTVSGREKFDVRKRGWFLSYQGEMIFLIDCKDVYDDYPKIAGAIEIFTDIED